jgi:type II secretory pathway pseudopilin PulG
MVGQPIAKSPARSQFMRARRLVADNRGVATSLIEAVMVIAIAAIISSMAIVASMDKVEDARMTRAIADTEMIGIAIHGFMNDTGFAPAFKAGTATGPSDEIFLVLESGGTTPPENSEAATPLLWPMDETDRDLLENQLVKNKPNTDGMPYPRIGEISYARTRGWNGPYVPTMPSADPWGNKYLVNVQLLTPKGVRDAAADLSLGVGQRPAAFVISAGPNRLLDTVFLQVADSFVVGGDDLVFRIQ